MQNDEFQASEIQPIAIDIETGGLCGYVTVGGERVHGALHYPIFELAVVVLNKDLSTRECITVAIDHPDSVLARCHEKALEMHTKSGLLTRIKSGEGFDCVAMTIEEATHYILSRLAELGVIAYNRKENRGATVVGSTVDFDLAFIDAQMPELKQYVHYRKIDVSTINLLSRTFWTDKALPEPAKLLNHTAKSDIYETIDELKAYTEVIGRSHE